MSFTTTNPWVQFAGNDSTTEFAFNHKIHDQGDVVVLLTVDATNVTTTQTITTHYTVADVATDAHDDTTPTITMVTSPATGETLTIYRQVDLIMDTSFATTEFWQSLSAEKQFELLMMSVQWMYLLVSRCAIGSLASDPVTTTLEEILATTPLSDLSALVAKATPVDADLLLLADSASSFANKKLTATNHWVNYLLAKHIDTSAGAGDSGKAIKLDGSGEIAANMIKDGADATAIHDNVNSEISAISAKGTVVDADYVIIEDSAASNAKKSVLFSVIKTYIAALQNVVEDTSPSLGGTLDAADNHIDNAKTITFNDEHDNGSSGASPAIDWTEGQKQKITLSANATFAAFTPPAGPCNLLLKIVQGASYTAAWHSSVKWPNGGTAPTITTGASSVDIISFYYDGTNYYAQAGSDFQ